MAYKRKRDLTDDFSDQVYSSWSRRKVAASTRPTNKKARLNAELVNLADYNKPPVPRVQRTSNNRSAHKRATRRDGSRNKPSRSSKLRKSKAVANKQVKTQSGNTKNWKPGAKPMPKAKPALGNKLLAEVQSLMPWNYWNANKEISEDSEDGSEEDFDDRTPLSHSRHYPPCKTGVQNIPWALLSGEVRNFIYSYIVEDEKEAVFNVSHYPYGVPRRSLRGRASETNFYNSHWSFTQVNRQVRYELMPLLIAARRVRTPLATVNAYIDTFHYTGQRTGWVEPICCGAPLRGNGVDVLQIVSLVQNCPSLHIQLEPTVINPVLEWLTPERSKRDFDELKIIHEISESFPAWCREADNRHPNISITTINISSSDEEDTGTLSGGDDDDDDDNNPRHRILIELGIHDENQYASDQCRWKPQLDYLTSYIFFSQLNEKDGIKICAKVLGGLAFWVLDSKGRVHVAWENQYDDTEYFFRAVPATMKSGGVSLKVWKLKNKKVPTLGCYCS